jgi:ABC-2 type transport system ATP-binding protein
VALLTVLVPRTPLVIMDEPTNALDPTMRDLLLAEVRLARERGRAVLFSSHVLAEVERVCDRVAILQAGRLVHLQVMSQLQAARLIQARFDGPHRELPVLPGLQVRSHDDRRLIAEYTGPLPELLTWLAAQPLTELRVEPLGLYSIYHRYHGSVE